jgi:hypothetical protein
MSTNEKYPVLFVRVAEGKYECVDKDPTWLAKLKFVFDNGDTYASLLGPLLVRHGDPDTFCHHYPAPFLFRSERERKMAADRRGVAPPPEVWIRRKLQLLGRLAGIEEKQAA